MKVEINDLLQVQMIRLSQMSVDLAGKATLFDAKTAVVGNWFEYDNMSHYIFCLNGNWDDYDNNGQTDGQIKMEAGMKNGVGIYDVKFSKKDLIPKELSEDRPMTFYFMKLHYLEHDYGYFGFSTKDGHSTRMLTLQAWLNNVSSALENVRMHMELNRLVSKLEDMSIRDELTGLYNRRVIDTLGKKSLGQGVRDHTKLMFFIADMDKLKDVNDRHGHLKGDMALSTIAEALKKAADDDEICIRLGGDEFMAIGLDYDEEKAESFANRVVEELNRFNKNSDFNIFISYGWNLIDPTENTTVEECLFTADYRMYQQKYHKASNHLMVHLFA
jgi:diguanylate cyclase (GGDEF)-like protein